MTYSELKIIEDALLSAGEITKESYMKIANALILVRTQIKLKELKF